jgi:hypothetical protein
VSRGSQRRIACAIRARARLASCLVAFGFISERTGRIAAPAGEILSSISSPTGRAKFVSPDRDSTCAVA